MEAMDCNNSKYTSLQTEYKAFYTSVQKKMWEQTQQYNQTQQMWEQTQQCVQIYWYWYWSLF